MVEADKGNLYEYFFDLRYAKEFSKDFAYGDKKDKDDEVTTELFNLFFNSMKNK